MLYLTVISLFICVALSVGTTLSVLVIRRSIVQERLDELISPQPVAESRPSLLWQGTTIQRFLAQLGSRMPISAMDREKYTTFLVGAGYRSENLPVFIGSKIMLCLLLACLFVPLSLFSGWRLPVSEFLLIEVALLIIGYLLPSLWLMNRVKARKLDIFHTLPDILDMLIVCVEAGMGLDAALIKATDQPQFNGNPLAEEFRIAWLEIRAGKPNSEALRDMARRTMVEDVSALATVLIQTEQFGTSLTQALRVHSDSLRTKRCQNAEEVAAKTAIKMLFPIVFFMFPALFVVLIGPALLRLKLFFT